jgi:hypothetical protein
MADGHVRAMALNAAGGHEQWQPALNYIGELVGAHVFQIHGYFLTQSRREAEEK